MILGLIFGVFYRSPGRKIRKPLVVIDEGSIRNWEDIHMRQ